MARVVITGIGAICSIGNSYPELGNALLKGQHGIAPLTLFPSSTPHPVAEVKKKLSYQAPYRTLQLALEATHEALQDAQLFPLSSSNSVGLSFSSCTSGMLELEKAFQELKSKGEVKFSFSDALSVGKIGEQLAQQYNIQGPMNSFSTACSSSANALACAWLWLQAGSCEKVVAGGADALCQITYYGFQSLKVMAERPCAPFDENREGMNIGEGAGVVVLETWESAQKRRAKIYAELLGVGMSADAYHMSSPDSTGAGAALAMKRAIQSASILPQEVDQISAHGTGTIQNDLAESLAIQKVFKNYKNQVRVTALKSYLGHTLGAAGILGIICAIHSIETGFTPPILRLEKPDPRCQLCYAKKGIEEKAPRIVLVNAFAFGGNNTSLVLKKFYE